MGPKRLVVQVPELHVSVPACRIFGSATLLSDLRDGPSRVQGCLARLPSAGREWAASDLFHCLSFVWDRRFEKTSCLSLLSAGILGVDHPAGLFLRLKAFLQVPVVHTSL